MILNGGENNHYIQIGKILLSIPFEKFSDPNEREKKKLEIRCEKK